MQKSKPTEYERKQNNREKYKKWYQQNKCRANKKRNEWHKNNPHSQKKASAKTRGVLKDSYIIEQLKSTYKFTNEEITPELINALRLKIKVTIPSYTQISVFSYIRGNG